MDTPENEEELAGGNSPVNEGDPVQKDDPVIDHVSVVEEKVEIEKKQGNLQLLIYISCAVLFIILIFVGIILENTRDFGAVPAALSTVMGLFGVPISIAATILLTVRIANNDHGTDVYMLLIPIIAGMAFAMSSGAGIVALGIVFLGLIIVDLLKRRSDNVAVKEDGSAKDNDAGH